MIRLAIKPLSLNNAYRGRRFATRELKDYKNAITLMLPKMNVPAGKLTIRYEFGVSSKASDADNLIKCVTDALSDTYGFNDRCVYEYHVAKRDVPKGHEYIDFEISPYLA